MLILKSYKSLLVPKKSGVQTIGNAVYRARVLYSMNHFGIHYDDLVLCNGQGVYKGGKSKLQEQLDALKNYTENKSNIKQQLGEDEVMVYPNPAHNYITIACKHATQLIITDLLGQTRQKNKLDNRLDENIIDINKLPLGIYFYKVIQLNNSQYSGKLLIE
jgi:hypothetical protein